MEASAPLCSCINEWAKLGPQQKVLKINSKFKGNLQLIRLPQSNKKNSISDIAG